MPNNFYRFEPKQKGARKPFEAICGVIHQERSHPRVSATVLEWLAGIGKEAIRNAELERLEKAPHIQTGNQVDAYGWALYFNGELRRYGFSKTGMSDYHPVLTKRGKPRKDSYHEPVRIPDSKRHVVGGDAAHDAIKNFRPPKNKGYCLYIFNAMWYSAIHERGWGNVQRMNVISKQIEQAHIEVEEVLSHLKGSVSTSLTIQNTSLR